METIEQLFNTFFDWQVISALLPKMFQVGLKNTLIISGVSSVIATVLGMGLALMTISRKLVFRVLARIYIDVFRGVPAILTVLMVSLGLGPLVRELTGRANPFPLAVIALSLMASAYIAEIFRSGIQSVEPGQLEAGRALGFRYSQAMFLIVIPQGIRRVLPALVNQFIVLIKESSLIYLLGLLASERDIFRIGQDASANNANLSPLVAAALVYLMLTVPLTHLVNIIDDRLRNGSKRPTPDTAAATIGGKPS